MTDHVVYGWPQSQISGLLGLVDWCYLQFLVWGNTHFSLVTTNFWSFDLQTNYFGWGESRRPESQIILVDIHKERSFKNEQHNRAKIWTNQKYTSFWPLTSKPDFAFYVDFKNEREMIYLDIDDTQFLNHMNLFTQ